MFEKMSPEMKNQYLYQMTDEDEKKALIELMDIENSKALKDFGNRPIENITFDEIKPYLTEEKKFVREITPNISLRSGPKGDYIFYKTNKMKKPQFFSLNISDNSFAKFEKIEFQFL